MVAPGEGRPDPPTKSRAQRATLRYVPGFFETLRERPYGTLMKSELFTHVTHFCHPHEPSTNKAKNSRMLARLFVYS
ncbi:MAG: hypothetical protein DCC59_14045 [Chloroflexi bacterium]|nr:hypothetical protein [Chloroflexi bacterium CFX1]MCQ3954441.1 hypothetical protein [Chloroflexota bacterium]RIK49776.1 MAG: hypothetical protein DCC59_14045 [Chloroflexota bacterium]